jgi:TRAP-type C4-dicarboxylate transport system substrate-binding protein
MNPPKHLKLVKRWLARCAIGAALVLPQSLATPAADAQARWVVKLGTAAFAHAPIAALLAKVSTVLEAEHPGRFWVKRLVDGALTRDRAGLARVATGEAHGYAATFDELVGALPDAAALNAPFAFDNDRDADAVLRTTGGAAIGDALATLGLRLVTIGPCEARVLFSRTRALQKPGDALGLSVARGPNPAYAGLAGALSMTQIDADQKADVRDATLSQLAAEGELLEGGHLTLTDHALECGVLVVSQRWIDGLPAQMQKTLSKLSRVLDGGEATKAQRAARTAILERAKAAGVEITTLSAKERQAFVAATREARTQMNGEAGSLARKLSLAAQAK